jgi:hypothetical protein
MYFLPTQNIKSPYTIEEFCFIEGHPNFHVDSMEHVCVTSIKNHHSFGNVIKDILSLIVILLIIVIVHMILFVSYQAIHANIMEFAYLMMIALV